MMRSALLLCVLFGLVGASFAASSYSYARGTLSSRNVVLANNVVGRLGLDGTGEVTLNYYSKAKSLQIFWTHTFSGFGAITANVVVGDKTFEISSSDFGTSGSVYEDASSWSSSEESAFITALNDGTATVLLTTSLYPNGIAQANLDNFDQVGTSSIWFSSDLSGSDDTTVVVKAKYYSDLNQFQWSIKYNTGKAGTTPDRIDFSSSITGQVIYSFDLSQSKSSILSGANLATFNILKSGLAVATAYKGETSFLTGSVVARTN